MTIEEYKKRLKDMEAAFRAAEDALSAEYAMSNNPYNKGDIIEDHFHIIEVQKIRWQYSYGSPPCCIYSGIELKKDLTPKIRQINTVMYQSNVKRKIEKL